MLDYAAARQVADSRIVGARRMHGAAVRRCGFDLVCCQFGAMFFPDRQSGYREAKRVLKPGGCFLFNVWDRIEENVFANDVTNALAEVFPNDPPRFLARTPHGYHDTALIRSELEKAGFSSVVIETRADQSRASSPRHPAVAYCQGTPLRNEIEARDAGRLEAATHHAASEDREQTRKRRSCCQNSGPRHRGHSLVLVSGDQSGRIRARHAHGRCARRAIFCNGFMVICPVQPRFQKYSASLPTQIIS